jgi:hypothetical protein
MLFNDLTVDEVFLKNFLEHLGCAPAVPRPFGVDDRDRPAFAKP